MQWHSLICSPESVRAYLAGVKSHDRRVIKLPKTIGDEYGGACWELAKKPSYYNGSGAVFIDQAHPIESYPWIVECPFGVPGDGLWISEAVYIERVWDRAKAVSLRYLANDAPSEALPIPWRIKPPQVGRYRGRIIPREWARIFRELTDIRVEPLQKIVSDEYKLDVFNEGICFFCEHPGTVYAPDNSEPPDVCGGHGGVGCHEDSGELYRRWWNSLNAKCGHGWDTNPHVWVLTTKETEERP